MHKSFLVMQYAMAVPFNGKISNITLAKRHSKIAFISGKDIKQPLFHLYPGMMCAWKRQPRGWFNIRMPSYQHRKSHCGDKTILRPSYLHNGISYAGKTIPLYWIRVHVSCGLCCRWLMTKLARYVCAAHAQMWSIYSVNVFVSAIV